MAPAKPHWDMAQRAAVVILKAGNFKNEGIAAQLGIRTRTIQSI